jgi:hypothetical protein
VRLKSKSLFIFGVGYVWGTKAGRHRFDALAQRLDGLVNSHLLRDYVHKVRALTKEISNSRVDEGAPAEISNNGEGEIDEEGEMDEEGDAHGPEGDEEEERSHEATSRRTRIRRRPPTSRR